MVFSRLLDLLFSQEVTLIHPILIGTVFNGIVKVTYKIALPFLLQ